MLGFAAYLAWGVFPLYFPLLDGKGQRRSNVVLLPFEEPHSCSLPCSAVQVWLAALDECKIILGMTPLHLLHLPALTQACQRISLHYLQKREATELLLNSSVFL